MCSSRIVRAEKSECRSPTPEPLSVDVGNTVSTIVQKERWRCANVYIHFN
jgi:hypothetical protein